MSKVLGQINTSLIEIKDGLHKLNLGVYGDPVNKNMGLLDSHRDHAKKIEELEDFKKKIEESKLFDKVESHDKLIFKLMHGIIGGMIVILLIVERKMVWELILKAMVG